jgi:hypothetical protein
MLSLPSEKEELTFLFPPPPVRFFIWNVFEVHVQFRAPSRNLKRGSDVLYRSLG